jgi:C1A family cysteine protease
VAIDYDDIRRIGNSTGALKIRNSWGTAWGERGYGWFPYDYITAGLAGDFWTLIKSAYLPTGNFD